MEKIEQLPLTPTNEQRLHFEIAWMQERIKNLEKIVHELLRDRINKEIADEWIKSTCERGFTPMLAQIAGRGEQIAALLDRWPVEQFPQHRWPPKPDL